MQYHPSNADPPPQSIPRRTKRQVILQYHAIPSNVKQNHLIPCNTMSSQYGSLELISRQNQGTLQCNGLMEK